MDGSRSTDGRTSRDVFAPGVLFPLAFVVCYAAPYFNLIDYSDLIPRPGARMALLAALGLWGYVAGLSLARLAWPTAGLEWPEVRADGWRDPYVLALLTAIAVVSLAALALAFYVGAMIPVLEANKEAARFAFVRKIGHPLNAAACLPIVGAIACGLYVLLSRRGLTASNAVAGFLVLISMAAQALLGHRGLPIFILAPLVICFHYVVRPFRVGV